VTARFRDPGGNVLGLYQEPARSTGSDGPQHLLAPNTGSRVAPSPRQAAGRYDVIPSGCHSDSAGAGEESAFAAFTPAFVSRAGTAEPAPATSR